LIVQLQALKKGGTKANLFIDFLSKGKLNVNMGRSYGNPRMRSFGSMIYLMNLPHKVRVSLQRQGFH
jgi:hypothetical protein